MEKNEAEEARARKEIREEKKRKKVKIQVKKNEKKGIFYSCFKLNLTRPSILQFFRYVFCAYK